MPLDSNWNTAVGLAILEHLVGLGIVERDRIDVEELAGRALDLVDRVVDQRQRREAEEVHLQQTDALDLLHRPLGDDFVAGALVERRILRDRFRGDDDSGGVNRRMTRHALEPARDAEQLLHLRVVLLHQPERFALLERFGQRHVERRRDLLRDLVDVRKRHLEDAPDVAHHRLGLHRSERDDLRDVLAAVLPGDVVDDLAAAPLAEVDVDIGQRHALGIQEPLEDEVEVDRVDVGNPQAVARPGCRPPIRVPDRPECPARGRSG